LMLLQFNQYFTNLPAPGFRHPVAILLPGRVTFATTDDRSSEQVTDRMSEIKNRNIITEVSLLNRPIARQAIRDKRFAGSQIKLPPLSFTLHLLAKLGRVFHTGDHRTKDALRFVFRWW
jgi:hypothetical protein